MYLNCDTILFLFFGGGKGRLMLTYIYLDTCISVIGNVKTKLNIKDISSFQFKCFLLYYIFIIHSQY